MDRITKLIGETTGWLSDAEIANLFGRRSKLRASVSALTGGRFRLPLPPEDEDVSLRCAAKDEADKARRLERQLDSKCPGGTTLVRNGRAMTGPRQRKRSA